MPAKKKRVSKEEHTFLSIEVTGFKAKVGAAINYEIRDSRHAGPGTKVYDFSSDLTFEGVCTYPENRAGALYSIDVHGHELQKDRFSATLEDYQARNADRSRKYRKVRGESRPVFDPPKGVGLVEKRRGENAWRGFLWVPPATLNDMLVLLPSITPLYLVVHELREGRQRWVVDLTLQTYDPVEEEEV